jgi:hypothetical protein
MTFSNPRFAITGAWLLALSLTVACGGSGDDGPGANGTGGSGGSGSAVNLGSAGGFVILAKSGTSSTGTTAITGNLGVSPIGYAAIVGLALSPTVPDASTVSATSPLVTGVIFASDYAAPTPANLTAAIGDMELAFTNAAGRAAGFTELGGGEIGGMTLSAGVYKWGTGVGITTDVTLNGSSTDVWVFQIAQNLTVASGARVVLAGGALAKNVFWQVAGAATLGTTAHVEGIVLCQTAITLETGASVNGRLLAQSAVTLDANNIVQPAP